ncbi:MULTISPECIES: hypothetical protein [unclassified Campylobacter]|uniref:hypothetical protein n=1 Tax=unclassified Campylobacter TaxID=2593542 RepID=UPI0015553CF6|nr:MULTISPECIES: hypothetical protein [unclassified Campylobacter]QKU36233.1 hypothetical protein CDOMC_a021 [Campylobacter sp. RM16192]
MATIAEKDILIEENAYVMAICKIEDEETIKKCKKLRNFLYRTSEELIDFKGTLKFIEKIEKAREK